MNTIEHAFPKTTYTPSTHNHHNLDSTQHKKCKLNIEVLRKIQKDGELSIIEDDIIASTIYPYVDVGDYQKIAKELISVYKTISKIISADISELTSVAGMNIHAATAIKVLGAAINKYHFPQPSHSINLTEYLDLAKYCQTRIGHKRIEFGLVIFLDCKNQVIADEIIQSGTVDRIMMYPRNIVISALKNYATSVVLSHNHPSGDVMPSIADIGMTLRIEAGLKTVDIKLLDHVIVSPFDHASMRGLEFID